MLFKSSRLMGFTTLMNLTLYSSVLFADHTSIGTGSGVASPIMTESALVLPQGKISLSLRSEFIDFDEFSDDQLTHLRESHPTADLHSVNSILGVSLGLFYGVSDNFMVGMRIPYLHRSSIREPAHADQEDEGHTDEVHTDEEHGDEIRIENLGDAEGIGDLTLFGQYRFYQHTDNLHAAFIFGLKAPTGKTSVRTEHGRLETGLQPGTGSWDGLLGASFTYLFAPFSLDASLLYSLTGSGSQNTDIGDILNYNAAISYRLGGGEAPVFYATRKQSAWDVVLELNGEWRDKEETEGVTNPDTGGSVVYLSPGLRFSSASRWSLSVSFGIPVFSDNNGIQSDPDYRLITGLSTVF